MVVWSLVGVLTGYEDAAHEHGTPTRASETETRERTRAESHAEVMDQAVWVPEWPRGAPGA
eukprot:1204664-Prymnesium_polylepis.1